VKRRLFVQGTSIRKQVLRQRRIHTGLAAQWEAWKNSAENIRRDFEDLRKPPVNLVKPAHD
jgi:hypothetical protein